MNRRGFLKTLLVTAPAVILAGPPKSLAARLFVRANAQYLELASTPVTAEPFTMACWVYRVSAGISEEVMALGVNGSGDSWHHLFVENNDRPMARTRDNAGAIRTAEEVTTLPTNAWYHHGGVWASSSSRILYHDGVNVASDTNAATVTGLNRVRVGQGFVCACAFDGRLAYAGLWNAALTAGEMAALAAKAHPWKVRPTNLVALAPVWGTHSPEIDLAGPRSWGFVGTGTPAAADGPPIGAVIR